MNGMNSVRKILAVEVGENIVYEVGKPLFNTTMLPRAECEPEDCKVKVLEIGEHAPMGPGDVRFYDVHLDNGMVVRVFNMMRVVLSAPMSIVPVQNQLVV